MHFFLFIFYIDYRYELQEIRKGRTDCLIGDDLIRKGRC